MVKAAVVKNDMVMKIKLMTIESKKISPGSQSIFTSPEESFNCYLFDLIKFRNINVAQIDYPIDQIYPQVSNQISSKDCNEVDAGIFGTEGFVYE